MGKHFALTLKLQGTGSVKPGAQAAQSTISYQPPTGYFLCIALIAVFLFYMFQVNSFSTKGFEIRRLQDQLTQLQNDHKRLEMEAAQLQSIQRVQSDGSINNMVPITAVGYLKNSSLSKR